MSNIEDILKAIDDLTALSFINIQELLPHRSRLENALRVLQEKVDATRAIQSKPATSNSSSVSIVESSNLNEAPCPPNSSNSHPEADKGVQNVLSVLSEEKISKKLMSYLSSTIPDLKKPNECDWFEEDPRLVDIRLSSRPNPTSHVNLRRGLSQRSLAVEYDEWEKNNFQISRVTELAQDPESSKSRQSHINQFVEANKHRFKDRNTALHGIKHGIRLLVFEKIYGCAGTSLVFFFIYGYFRSVKYKFYPNLAESLEHTSWDKVVKNKSSWLIQCQHQYDEFTTNWQQHQAHWRRKRRRSDSTGLSDHHSQAACAKSPQENVIGDACSRAHSRPRLSDSEQVHNLNSGRTPESLTNSFSPLQFPLPSLPGRQALMIATNSSEPRPSQRHMQAGGHFCSPSRVDVDSDTTSRVLALNTSLGPGQTSCDKSPAQSREKSPVHDTIPQRRRRSEATFSSHIWQNQPQDQFIVNQPLQPTASGNDNTHNTQGLRFSNHSEPETIPIMHPIQFPQFVLPTSIDTVVPSTSPQFFLPAPMDAEVSTYSIYREPAVDIMVSSDFPQYGPYASAQHTSNNNTRTGTPDTFPFHHSTNSFNPNAGAVGIMTTG